jgi:hypothetical protein
MHFRVRDLMHQRCESFRGSLFGKQSDFAFLGNSARWRDFVGIAKFDATISNKLFESEKVVTGVAGHRTNFGQWFTIGLLFGKDVRDFETRDHALALGCFGFFLGFAVYERCDDGDAFFALADVASELPPSMKTCDPPCVGPLPGTDC